MASPIFTNHALTKMKYWGISESQALDTFNSGAVEKRGGGNNAIKKYAGYEIGVYYVTELGKYKILSVWKRNRR